MSAGAVVHLVWAPLGDEPIERFLGSYERHDGVAPDIRVGTSDREFLDAAAWLARLRHG